ncbi:MAG: type II secretion system F family protein [Motilibacteraceae bacterium]
MSRLLRAVLGTACAGLLLLASAPAALAGQGAGDASVTAVVDGDRLELRVTAADVPAGTALDASTVTVTMDGTPLPAAVVAAGQEGTSSGPARSLLLAVDTSGSMRGSGLVAARQAAQVLLDGLPADVAVGLVTFDGTARLLVPPSRDRAGVTRGLSTVQANAGDTALYDALVLGAKALGSTGQRTLVVLSDGADTASRTDQGAAEAALRAAGVDLALVGFRTPDGQAEVLTRLARAAGGRVVTAADAGQLSAAFGQVARSFDRTIAVTASLPAGAAAGRHEVRVSLRFGPAAYQAATSVTTQVPRAAGTPAADAAVPVNTVPMHAVPVPIWLLAIVFCALVLLSATLLLPVTGNRRRRMRDLEFYTLAGRRQQVKQSDPAPSTGLAQGLLGVSERIVERQGWNRSMALRLDRADVRWRPHEWLLVQVAAVVVGMVLVALLGGHLLAGTVLGALLGGLAPVAYLRVRTRRRLNSFADGLPETLQLVASSLRSGFSLSQALDAAVQDGRQPLAGEFARALAEARLGSPVEDALDRVADRMRSVDFHWVVMAIRVQHQVGGNLAEVLETTVRTMRERAAMRRQVRALSAEGRLSGYVLIALPIGMFGYMFLTRRDYVDGLWTTGLGLVMSAAALLLTTVGWFWMRKVAQVEV